MSDEVKGLWKDVKHSVMEEEKRQGGDGTSAEELKERFGGLEKEDGIRRVYDDDESMVQTQTQKTTSKQQKQVPPLQFTSANAHTKNTTDNTNYDCDTVMHDRDTAVQIDSTTRQEGLITPITPGRSGRRPSWGYVRPRESSRRRASEDGTSSTPKRPSTVERRRSAVKSGNMYEVERDPRKRGR